MSTAVLEVGNVLNQLLSNAGISEAKLGRIIGVPRATINRIASGRTPDPRASTLHAIAKYFNVTVDQLLGNQPIFQHTESSILTDPNIEVGQFALRVKGDSMWPQFQENTILIVDPTREQKNRDFVVVHIKKSNEILFRQLIIDGKYKFIKAINDIFPTIQLQDADKIIGVVIQTRNNLT